MAGRLLIRGGSAAAPAKICRLRVVRWGAGSGVTLGAPRRRTRLRRLRRGGGPGGGSVKKWRRRRLAASLHCILVPTLGTAFRGGSGEGPGSGGSSSSKLLPGERSRMSPNSSSTLGCVIVALSALRGTVWAVTYIPERGPWRDSASNLECGPKREGAVEMGCAAFSLEGGNGRYIEEARAACVVVYHLLVI